MFVCTGLMQLAEYYMWHENEMINIFGNVLGIIALYLQNSGILIKPNNLIYILSVWYIYVLKKYKDAGYPKSTINENGNMEWGFSSSLTNTELILGTILFIIGTYTIDLRMKIEYAYAIAMTLLLAYSIYKKGNKIYDPNKWGSYWCHYSNYINLLFSLYIYFN
jgi:hypothetical protein